MLSKNEILNRKKKFGFANEKFIEMFIWNFEIFKLLSRLSDSFVLKGGTAVQLYLPVENQRASIDLDITTPLQEEEIEEIFNRIEFVERYIPKRPVPRLLLMTYIAKPSSVMDDSVLEVKIDIFYDEHPMIKPKTIKKKKLFALDIDFPVKIVSKGYLIGDKLLTLATRSVGIPKHRVGELPKHVYDISKLTYNITKTDLNDLIYSFKYNLNREKKIKNIKVEDVKVMDDVLSTLDRFSRIDLKDGVIKRRILNFQSMYLTNLSRISFSEWILDAIRLKILMSLLKGKFRKKLSTKSVFERYSEVVHGLEELKKLNRKQRQEKSKEYLQKIRVPYWKVLKGKPLERIYLEFKYLEYR
ncbi:MAG: hypothetical protein DRJ64_08075 [Thermoprotei archaeon]|nr:MAG: hypothetical protein DRJ64_08075 [Thermoprotei archaeon]